MAEKKELSPNSVLRFGVFQANLAARELRKHGVRIRLPGQPFCLLSMLLQRPGEIVTREEMRQRLWPSDTFVDFEHSLNSAIKKLRAALADSPENSRYVETVPRVGYRFIAPIAQEQASGAGQSFAEPLSQLKEASEKEISKSGAVFLRRKALWAGVGGATAIGVFWVALLPPAPPRVTSTTRLTNNARIDPWAMPVTDGARIYFLEREGGHWDLAQTSIQGGTSQLLGRPFPDANARILDISRDLSQFLVGSFVLRDTEMPLWAVPAQGGAPRRIGNIQARSAVWTPDGKGVLYPRERDLILVDADGQSSRKLLSAPGPVFDAAYSPNGKVLRFSFADTSTNTSKLWEAYADGTHLHALFSSPPESFGDCCGRWTPDGKYFIYLAWHEGKQEVWALREKKELPLWKRPKPVKLVAGPIPFYGAAITSQDGHRIFAIGGNPESDVVRYEPKARRFLPIPGLPRSSSVVYCPTGQWITYRNDVDGSLWRSKADGSQVLQLTHPPLVALDPQWSPDASQILFTGQEPGHLLQALVVPRDGGEARAILPQNANQSHPHWLSGGKSVSFTVTNLPGGVALQQAVYVAHPETHQISELPGSEDLDSVAWSPDGRFFAGATQDYRRLRLYDLRLRKWTDLAGGTLVSGAIWAPDSQSIYYQDLLGENEPIYRIWLPGGRREKIYDFAQELRSGYFRCALYAMNPDGTLLASLSRGSADLYAFDTDLP